MSKSTYDLLYDRQSEELIATENANFLSVQYAKVLAYLDDNDKDMASRIKKLNEQVNFPQLRQKNVRNLTDTELTSFLNVTSQFRKLFDKYLSKISKSKYENAKRQSLNA